jgi:hypothetical protein
MPIFASGSVAEGAAQHDFDVIASTPSTVQLTAMTVTEKIASGVARNWYEPAGPVCPTTLPVDADGNDTDCDEYPFYASA